MKGDNHQFSQKHFLGKLFKIFLALNVALDQSGPTS